MTNKYINILIGINYTYNITESELSYYRSIRDEIVSMTVDTITLANSALDGGSDILIEGANATSKLCICAYDGFICFYCDRNFLTLLYFELIISMYILYTA